jgi:hypothetical protein
LRRRFLEDQKQEKTVTSPIPSALLPLPLVMTLDTFKEPDPWSRKNKTVALPFHALIGFQGRGCEDGVYWCHLMFQTHDRSPTLQVNITKLIDDVQCYETVRDLHWPDGITCPACQPTQVIKRGVDDTESARQRYECTDCHKRFDDLTDTILVVLHR